MTQSLSDACVLGEKMRLRSLADLRPHERHADSEAAVPVDADEVVAAVLRELSTLDPVADAVTLMIAVENLAFGSPTITHAILPTIQTLVLLESCGSRSQKDKYIPTVLQSAGRNPVSMLMIESGGVGPSEWCTVARRVRSEWRVSGTKVAVNLNGTDLHLVAAKSGTSQVNPVVFLASGARPGQTRNDAPQASSLALKASRLGSIALSEAVFAEADRLSGTDDRPLALAQAIGYSRLLLGAVALGAAFASLTYAQEWVVKRTAFGKPLSAFEGVAFDIADTDTRLNASRYVLRQVAHDIHFAESVAKVDDMVARTLARVTTACAIAATDGVQLMGVHGIIHEHPQELFYRTAGSLSVLDVDPLRSSFRLI
jgi:alkylation response protein AidB-like acyl-CoA dehydrogenase